MLENLIRSISEDLNSKSNDLYEKYQDMDVDSSVAFIIHDVLQSSPIAMELKDILRSDPVFESASEKAGYYGRIDSIISAIFHVAISVTKDGQQVQCNYKKAIEELGRIRSILTGDTIVYKVHARLMGVSLEDKVIKVNDEIRIVELNDDEIKEREPVMNAHFIDSLRGSYSEDHRAEIQLRLTIPIVKTEELCILKTFNTASEKARVVFEHLLNSLYILLPGKIDLGPINLSQPFGGTTASFSSGRILNTGLDMVTLNSNDAKALIDLYSKITSNDADGLLDMVIRRLVTGRQRTNIEDKLVDYTISFESILTTSEGNQSSSELSYRFKLNGASIISECISGLDRRQIFDFMGTLYSIRSCIVHGLGNDKINKLIGKTDYADISKFVEQTEDYLRYVIMWLIYKPIEERPYIKKGEWESLLWKNHA